MLRCAVHSRWKDPRTFRPGKVRKGEGLTYVQGQGRSQEFVLEGGTKQGDWGQKSPSGVQKQSPCRVWGEALKLKTCMLITIAIMC